MGCFWQQLVGYPDRFPSACAYINLVSHVAGRPLSVHSSIVGTFPHHSALGPAKHTLKIRSKFMCASLTGPLRLSGPAIFPGSARGTISKSLHLRIHRQTTQSNSCRRLHRHCGRLCLWNGTQAGWIFTTEQHTAAAVTAKPGGA